MAEPSPFNPSEGLGLNCFPCTQTLIFVIQVLTIPTVALLIHGIELDSNWNSIVEGKSPFPKLEKNESYFHGKYISKDLTDLADEDINKAWDSMSRKNNYVFEMFSLIIISVFLGVSVLHLLGSCLNAEKLFYKQHWRYLTPIIYVHGCIVFIISGCLLWVITFEKIWPRYHLIYEDLHVKSGKLLLGRKGFHQEAFDTEHLSDICKICYNTLLFSTNQIFSLDELFPANTGHELVKQLNGTWYFDVDFTKLGFCVNYPVKIIPIILCGILAVLCSFIVIIHFSQGHFGDWDAEDYNMEKVSPEVVEEEDPPAVEPTPEPKPKPVPGPPGPTLDEQIRARRASYAFLKRKSLALHS